MVVKWQNVKKMKTYNDFKQDTVTQHHYWKVEETAEMRLMT